MSALIYSIDEVRIDILKSNPPQLLVSVKGYVTREGWTNPVLMPLFNKFHEPGDGVYEFNFIATPPVGCSPQVITPITAGFLFPTIPADLKKVVVYSTTNFEEADFPFKAEKLIEPHIATRKATGHSNSFSFDEAFRDAIDNLPQITNPHPDQLIEIKVTEIGALIGGFPGFHQLYVNIEATQ